MNKPVDKQLLLSGVATFPQSVLPKPVTLKPEPHTIDNDPRIFARAYSTFEIKASDTKGDKRIIRGVASTPSPDRMDDIVEPDGAKFKLPLPLLWQHSSRDPIGNVVEVDVTKDGIAIVAEIAKDVDETIERAWRLIKAGLVRGLSIGFRALDVEEIKGSYGYRIKSWEWLELSAVTIPANQDASISNVKKFSTEPVASDTAPSGGTTKPSGVSGKPIRLKEAIVNTIAEQITALETKRAATVAAMEGAVQKSLEEGRSTSQDEQELFDEKNAEVDAIDSDLNRLRSLEKAKAVTAKPIVAQTQREGTDERSSAIIIKTEQKLPPGIAFARFARCKALARIDGESPRVIAKELYGEDSIVYAVMTKAAVPAASTTNATWLKPLVDDFGGVFGDFVEFLRPQTILGKFGTGGIPGLRSVPFRVPLVGQTSGGQGYWVGEGKPKPLTKFDFARSVLEPLKVANIAVATMEVLRDSSPSADAIIRDGLAGALKERLDIDFVDPAKAAVAGVSPASITNGVTAIPSSGSDSAAVRADIQALFGAFIAANNPPSSAVFIMTTATAMALGMMQNPMGNLEFPGVGMNGGTLMGIPVITSDYVPDGVVILANANDIYLADEGGITVDMSREASLQMDDAPTNDSVTPTPAPLVSLWQTNSVGFLAERTINWKKRRAEAVQLLTGVEWGAPAP
jgi:HK97 family phage prohead protease